jgi:hypothetical protein
MGNAYSTTHIKVVYRRDFWAMVISSVPKVLAVVSSNTLAGYHFGRIDWLARCGDGIIDVQPVSFGSHPRPMQTQGSSNICHNQRKKEPWRAIPDG